TRAALAAWAWALPLPAPSSMPTPCTWMWRAPWAKAPPSRLPFRNKEPRQELVTGAYVLGYRRSCRLSAPFWLRSRADCESRSWYLLRHWRERGGSHPIG